MIIWPWLTYFNNFLGNFNTITQSCPTFCYPMDCNPPGSLVHGISQARTLECVAISSSRGSSQLRGLNSHFLCIFCIGRQVFTTGIKKKKEESCSVISNSLWPHGLCSPWNSPGQNTRVGSLSLLQGSYQPRDQTQVSHIAGRFITTEPPGKPFLEYCLRTYQKVMQERHFSLLYKLNF